ncbi:MAG TPA: hypothetical protein VFD07_13660 [Candidatus Krumholzibacteria bacterium]|jgi:hypothetical protein|nr:hypothetical protein [Candidatus Krumholzibacteria bacterium]
MELDFVHRMTEIGLALAWMIAFRLHMRAVEKRVAAGRDWQDVKPLFTPFHIAGGVLFLLGVVLFMNRSTSAWAHAITIPNLAALSIFEIWAKTAQRLLAARTASS